MRWARSWRAGSPDDSKKIVHAIYRLAGGGSMVDLGCRSATYTRDLRGSWVDIDPQPESPSETLKLDIFDAILFFKARNETFDLAILTDVIEHFTKTDGQNLLLQLKDISRAVLIFTPTGELWTTEAPGPHTHRSGWTPEELWSQDWNIWEFPTFHRFSATDFHGAFWAWKFHHKDTPSAEEVSLEASVPL